MTLNDLECPIHLKVRFTDSTLDVVAFGFDHTHTRGQRASGLEGLAPLPPCGQLTRCFSAVAELLVKIRCAYSASIPLEYGKNLYTVSTTKKIGYN